MPLIESLYSLLVGNYNGSYLNRSVDKSIVDSSYVINNLSVKNVLNYISTLKTWSLVLHICMVISASFTMFACIYNKIYSGGYKSSFFSNVVNFVKYLCKYPMLFSFNLICVLISLTTIRSCVFFLSNLDGSNYFIYICLLISLSPVLLTVYYFATYVYDKFLLKVDDEVNISKMAYHSFIIKSLTVRYVINLFVMASLAFIIVRPTYIEFFIYISNKFPDELKYVIDVFLKLSSYDIV